MLIFILSKFNFITWCHPETDVLNSALNHSQILQGLNDVSPVIGIAMFAFSVAVWCGPSLWSYMTSASSDSSASEKSGDSSSVSLNSDSGDSSASLNSNIDIASLKKLDTLIKDDDYSIGDLSEKVLETSSVSSQLPAENADNVFSTVCSKVSNLIEPVKTDILYRYNNNDPIFRGRLDLDNLIIHLKEKLVNEALTNTILSLVDFDNALEMYEENPFDQCYFKIPKTLHTDLVVNLEIDGSTACIASDPDAAIVTTLSMVDNNFYATYDLAQIIEIFNKMDAIVEKQLAAHPLIQEKFVQMGSFLNTIAPAFDPCGPMGPMGSFPF